jgi:hypothetical protein
MLELHSEVEAITTSKNNVVVTNAVWKERQRFLEKILLSVQASLKVITT